MIFQLACHAFSATERGTLLKYGNKAVFLARKLGAVNFLAAQVLCNAWVAVGEMQLTGKELAKCRIELMVGLYSVFL